MILELLDTGERNAKTAKELAKNMGVSVRDVMQAVRVERLAGLPICSSAKGYFLAETETDLQITISRLYKQARETRKVAEALKISGVKEDNGK